MPERGGMLQGARSTWHRSEGRKRRKHIEGLRCPLSQDKAVRLVLGQRLDDRRGHACDQHGGS